MTFGLMSSVSLLRENGNACLCSLSIVVLRLCGYPPQFEEASNTATASQAAEEEAGDFWVDFFCVSAEREQEISFFVSC